jgi:hypothetical protein
MSHTLKVQESETTPAEPAWIGIRFLDPVGKVFKKDGYYYRAVYPHQVDYVNRVLHSAAYRVLASNGQMVVSRPTSESLEGFGLLLRSRELPWRIPHDRWVTRTLKQAALSWLDMSRTLHDSSYELADAHHANFALDARCLPVWVDLGSIQPAAARITALSQFLCLQAYPLVALCSSRKVTRLIRPLLSAGGIGFDEVRRICPLEPKIYLLRALDKLNDLADRSAKVRNLRPAVFSVLKSVIRGLNDEPAFGKWSSYRNRELTHYHESGHEDDPRVGAVMSVVDSLQPASLLDVGANDGYFASIFAARGIKTLAIDPDEFALSKFVRWSNGQSDSWQGCAAGCLGSFHGADEKADLVLGLALTHHLALTDFYKFDYIAKRFAQMSDRCLVTEFMPNGLNSLETPVSLPPWYRLDVFLQELGNWWRHVSVVDYRLPANRAPRTLIVCRDKRG